MLFQYHPGARSRSPRAFPCTQPCATYNRGPFPSKGRYQARENVLRGTCRASRCTFSGASQLADILPAVLPRLSETSTISLDWGQGRASEGAHPTIGSPVSTPHLTRCSVTSSYLRFVALLRSMHTRTWRRTRTRTKRRSLPMLPLSVSSSLPSGYASTTWMSA